MEALNYLSYREYLESPHWQFVRDAAIWAARERCQLCGSRRDLQVHHRHYGTLGDEGPDDLTVLCRRCHEVFSLGVKGA